MTDNTELDKLLVDILFPTGSRTLYRGELDLKPILANLRQLILKARRAELQKIQNYNYSISEAYEVLTFPGTVYMRKRIAELEKELQA